MMNYGFLAINGKKWLDSWVDIYNNLSKQIEQSPNDENLKNERHHFYMVASGMIKPERVKGLTR